MPQNFIESCREQGFLLPPDVREWLPADHLAWFVVDAVAGMDLHGFYAAYRADGHGRAAYEPSVVVALILYAFATDVRSSRAIERHCRQDVAYRVVTGNLVPDHVRSPGSSAATSRRWLVCSVRCCGCAPGGVGGALGWCRSMAPGWTANASRGCEQSVWADRAGGSGRTKATDEAEDEEYGEARGDELPEQLRTPRVAVSSSVRPQETCGARTSAQS